jgi:hypothetical protein
VLYSCGYYNDLQAAGVGSTRISLPGGFHSSSSTAAAASVSGMGGRCTLPRPRTAHGWRRWRAQGDDGADPVSTAHAGRIPGATRCRPVPRGMSRSCTRRYIFMSCACLGIYWRWIRRFNPLRRRWPQCVHHRPPNWPHWQGSAGRAGRGQSRCQCYCRSSYCPCVHSGHVGLRRLGRRCRCPCRRLVHVSGAGARAV